MTDICGERAAAESPAEVSWAALGQSGHLPRFLVLCLAVWLHAASSMLAATTLPSAVDEFGGAHLISWAFALYLLGSILAGAGSGLAVQRIGLRRAFQASGVLYAIGSGVCAMAWTMEVVVAGRLVQGFGGGGLLALVYIALNRSFPRALMPRLLALISATWSTSAFCGPLIGGTFATLGEWRLGFAAFVVQAGVFLVLFTRQPAADDDEDRGEERRFPVLGLAILSASILAVTFAGASFDRVISPVLCAAGIALFLGFLWLDRGGGDARMLPIATLSVTQPAGTGLVMVFCAAAATMSFIVFGPLFLENLYGLSPLSAGYIVAVEAVAWGGSALLFAGAARSREVWLIRCGTALVVLGVVGFAYAMPSGNLWTVITCAAAQGAGFGMMWGFLVRRLTGMVAGSERDKMSSAIPTLQQIGFAIGSAAAGIVANASGLGDTLTVDALGSAAFWVFAAFIPLALLSLPAAWRLSAKVP